MGGLISDQQNTMNSITLDKLKQIVDVNGKLDGWNFSRVRAGRDPVLWDYVDVVRQYIKPSDRVLDIGTGGGEIFFSLAVTPRATMYQ